MQEIKLKVNGGTLVAWVQECGKETSQAGICYIPDDDTCEIDLCCAEVKGDGLAGKPDNKDIDVYLWGDPYTEDYTEKVSIANKDIMEALS